MSSSRKIGVLLGGLTIERDISLRAGEAVLSALRHLGHETCALFVDRDIDMALRQTRVDTAFLAVRGRYSTDGCLQGLLEFHKIPYTGSGVLASALAMNRAQAKDLFRMANLPVSPGYIVNMEDDKAAADRHGSFGFPVLVRPVTAALLLRSTWVRDELELESALDEIARLDCEALVERLPPGPSVCVAILDGIVLGSHQFSSKMSHYSSALEEKHRPEERLSLSPTRCASIHRLALQAYDALGCEGPVCVELCVNEHMNETIVDVDTAPLLLPTSAFASIAEEAGLDYTGLIEEILNSARLRAHGRPKMAPIALPNYDGPALRQGMVPEAN
jgi:D-alanine-D-alanine ligase